MAPKIPRAAREPIDLLERFLSHKRRWGSSGGGGGGGNLQNGYLDWAASRVQAWWRMTGVLRAYTRQRFSLYHIAAMQIQYQWRGVLQRRYLRRQQEQRESMGIGEGPSAVAAAAAAAAADVSPAAVAAAIIQRAWRRCADMRIFRYYRDLIKFRNVGDPKALLRAVNPGESHLLDDASGTHVRFRLGGASFPPTVYYKIYTHNPLCDIGAFAPRDYASCRPSAGAARAKHLHRGHEAGKAASKGAIRVGGSYFGTTVNDVGAGMDRWYHRIERNGWRPVTLKVMSDADKDEVNKETRARAEPFHFSRVRRGEERVKRRKYFKRRWLQQMYREGMAQERQEEGGNGAAAVLPLTADGELQLQGPYWEEDADELLQWSEALDYDAYMADWRGLGCSGPSDLRREADAYELDYLRYDADRSLAAGGLTS